MGFHLTSIFPSKKTHPAFAKNPSAVHVREENTNSLMPILPLARSPGSSFPAVLLHSPPRTMPAISWHHINLDLEEENIAGFLKGPAIQNFCKISILL